MKPECYRASWAATRLPCTMMIPHKTAVRNKKVPVNGKTYAKGLAGRVADGVEVCVCRGLTRAEISRRMGYKSDTSLSKWANGDATPGPENLAKLATATGLSLDWLLAERGPMFASDGAEGTRLQVIGEISKTGTIDPATLRAIQQMIDDGVFRDAILDLYDRGVVPSQEEE